MPDKANNYSRERKKASSKELAFPVPIKLEISKALDEPLEAFLTIISDLTKYLFLPIE